MYVDMYFTAIVAHQDPETCEFLSNLLTERMWGVTGIATTGQEAIDAVFRNKADIVFLDPELRDQKGTYVAQQLATLFPHTESVLVLADSTHPSWAFEIDAVDYIVKPFERERLHKSLYKIECYLFGKRADPRFVSSFIGIRNNNEIEFIDQRDIVLISSEKRVTKIYLHSPERRRVIKVSESLCSFEKRLHATSFFRTHRSYLINLRYLHKIYPSGQTYIATFKGLQEIAYVSKNKIGTLYKMVNIG
ncbi:MULTISPECIES: LytTR family DNA-binding domain-containing protein [Brevibacillus]|jgi:DNA-binding LytR/AlgR family response regulator|uniref:LytR/AlgR family response regulator transcription factor n=1 Tax=Brevibacillus TaxID=55080 RepID=UPI001491C50B|nr:MULTISPECIES: LytTR family DNA-binding domain-containing protein [Brevibacillus]MBR8660378.1 response regulator transcription factor [Brevibacillus sp. NL20B1]NNV03596.1 response regulator transcription factor [Brevibacillus sp. MCWH]